MLKAALIGFGGISTTHRRGYCNLEKEGKVKLVAAYDINPNAFKTRVAINLGDVSDPVGESIHFYTDLDEMIAKEEIDFVDICIPTYKHRELSEKLLRRGYHVLCEKPMALTSADCAEMIRAAKESGKELMIGLKTISGTYVDNVMWFEVVGSGTIINKRIALVKNNRPVDRKKVDQFMALFANYDKYEKAYPIIVTRTLPLIDAGYTVTDVNGKEISRGESHNYYVVLDGQHRTIALMQLASTGKEKYATIPNVHLKEINAENVGEYLVDINNVGTSWTAKDKMIVAALTKKDELFENIAERLKEGFNPSTAALIYTKKKIGAALLNKILKSEEYNLPQGAVVDIERGNKFINICKSAGMGIKKLTNRFYIGGFNQFATARSDEDAFEALNNLIGKLNDEMLKKVKCEEDFNGILKEAFESGRYEKSETETNNEETVKEAA